MTQAGGAAPRYRRISSAHWLRYIPAAAALVAAVWLFAGAVFWPTPDPLPSQPPEVVFVLSSGIRKDSTLDQVGTDRLLAGIRHMRATGAGRLVTSRVRVTLRKFNVVSTTDRGQHEIVDSTGLGERWTILPGWAASTRDEMLLLRASFPTTTRIAIVTSRLHSRRACAAARRVGFTVSCLASEREKPWWKFPYRLIYEMLAWSQYRANGWI